MYSTVLFYFLCGGAIFSSMCNKRVRNTVSPPVPVRLTQNPPAA
ncbi:hypothetical protein HMPREF9248_0013 [Fannyhessea vaginae PB189-T1-4]|uniref:Lipoprotein n=1 Tax=Fannyhessea vaginae PB189-T1-4 TaxID=866774 RepID=A0ABN0B1J4_9ACTN|nr:hypothetical protein HMPREF9248_0013 [Fannyhessea vaginae PB189-T1-4]